MEEEGGDDGRIGEEGEDPHLAAAGGTEQWQHVVDPREQDGPADSGRGGALTRRLGGNGRGGGIPFGRRRLGPAEGHDVGPEPGIGSQHTVVAVTMNARGRDELGERVEELERPKHQLGAAVDVGFWEPVEEAALR